MAAGGVVLGDQLGLYAALAEGPQTPEYSPRTPAPRLATSRSGCAAKPPAATSSTTPQPATYPLTDEQAFALTDPDGPVVPAGRLPARDRRDARPRPRLAEAFRTGEGIGWHEHDEDVFVGCERFFRPGYSAHLVAVVAPGTRRRRGAARGRRDGGRRGLRSRRVDDP